MQLSLVPTLLSLLLLLSVSSAADQCTAESCAFQCVYAFTKPWLPTFQLPPAQLSSPGDVTLNPNNTIRMCDGSPLNDGQGCNGYLSDYLVDGKWTSEYVGSDGITRNTIDVFYATAHDKLNIRTIQTWQSNLGQILQNRTVRLNITCNNGCNSCFRSTAPSSTASLRAGHAADSATAARLYRWAAQSWFALCLWACCSFRRFIANDSQPRAANRQTEIRQCDRVPIPL